VGQERLGPSYFFISLVLGPLNSLLGYVPSSRYVYMELGSSFLFLQEQIKDIIKDMIICPSPARRGVRVTRGLRPSDQSLHFGLATPTVECRHCRTFAGTCVVVLLFFVLKLKRKTENENWISPGFLEEV
jgi:hypothetical protein